MAKRSYRELAEDDLRVAQKSFDFEEYTYSARLCQQFLEKMFKERIEEEQDSSNYSLMSTHNLTLLVNKLISIQALDVSDSEMLFIKTLKEYYFDLNYPNEANTILTKEEANKALERSKEIVRKIKWKKPMEITPEALFKKKI